MNEFTRVLQIRAFMKCEMMMHDSLKDLRDKKKSGQKIDSSDPIIVTK